MIRWVVTDVDVSALGREGLPESTAQIIRVLIW